MVIKLFQPGATNIAIKSNIKGMCGVILSCLFTRYNPKTSWEMPDHPRTSALTAVMFCVFSQSERWSCTRMRHSPTASTLWTISWWCTTRQITHTTVGRRDGTLTLEPGGCTDRRDDQSTLVWLTSSTLFISLFLYLFLQLWGHHPTKHPFRCVRCQL